MILIFGILFIIPKSTYIMYVFVRAAQNTKMSMLSHIVQYFKRIILRNMCMNRLEGPHVLDSQQNLLKICM